VRHGCNGPDHAEGSVLRQGDAIFAAEGVRLQEFDARRLLAAGDEFFDLVLEAADFGLFQFLAAQFFGAVDANTADAIDGLLPVAEAALLELRCALLAAVTALSTSSKTPQVWALPLPLW
jgi:hypothetical protein